MRLSGGHLPMRADRRPEEDADQDGMSSGHQSDHGIAKKIMSPDESPVNMMVLMVIFILIFLLGIFYAVTAGKETSGTSEEEDAVSLTMEWTFEEEGGSFSFPVDLRGGTGVTLTAVLPDDLDDSQSLIIEAQFKSIEIVIDGVTVYSAGTYENGLFTTAAGNYVAILALAEEYSGADITISVTGQEGNPDASLSAIFIQNRADYILEITSDNLMRIAAGIFCCVLGIVLAVVWMFRIFKRALTRRRVNADYLYMSILMSAYGLYLLTSQSASGMLTGTSTALGLIYYVSFGMTAVAAMGITFYLYDAKSMTTELVLLVVQANVVVQFLLFFAGVCDFTQMKQISVLMNLVAVLSFVHLTIRQFRLHIRTNFVMNLLSVIPAGAFFLASLLRYARGVSGELLLMCAEGVIVINVLFRFLMATYHMMQDGVLLKRVEERAYTDALTGLGNRRAYSEELDHIRSVPGRSNLIIAEFDVNGLKETNDNFGHAVGDELLITVADCLRNSFSRIGKCYRIGGDEFCILAVCDRSDFEEAEEEYLRRMRESAEGFVHPPSASYGFACQCEHPDLSIDDLRQIVDAQMYASKERYYNLYGNDRRRNRYSAGDPE